MQVIAHGIDVVRIERIERMLNAHGTRFLDRCFTERERAYAEQARRGRAERYAARFACKEAVLKALGTGWRDGISWRDISVGKEPSGQPTLALTGLCAELAGKLGIASWLVSLSHCGPLAMASVIACGQADRPPDPALPEGGG